VIDAGEPSTTWTDVILVPNRTMGERDGMGLHGNRPGQEKEQLITKAHHWVSWSPS
jgi:hypothetical protein